MVWYSHLWKNFPQFVVVHTVRGFSVVNEAEVNVFLEFSCFFFMIQQYIMRKKMISFASGAGMVGQLHVNQ